MGNKISLQKLKFKSFNNNNNNDNKKQANSMIMNKEEINLINEEDKDLKFYFNSENNVHRQHNLHFLTKYLFQCNISSPVNENLIKGGAVLDIG
jgi:phosphate-selective porin